MCCEASNRIWDYFFSILGGITALLLLDRLVSFSNSKFLQFLVLSNVFLPFPCNSNNFFKLPSNKKK